MEGRTILLAVDMNEHSKHAFEWFLTKIFRPEDHVVICHIPESPHLNSLSFSAGLRVPAEDWAKSIQEVHDKTDKLREDYSFLLQNKNIKNFKFVGEHHSKPARGILEEAGKCHADLIVMGTHGHHALGRAFHGSVSDSVIHHSPIPVLICPSKA